MRKIMEAAMIPLLLVLAGQAFAEPAKPFESRVYNVGIVPQQSATKLARTWAPILKYLSEKSALNLRFKTAPNIPVFEERLAAGEYDFAYMNPYHYTVFHEKPGYEAFAHASEKKIKGIIVVRKDSPIQDLQELDGRTLAFPSPAAFAASVLPRAHFRNNGIAIEAKYVASHDSVYRGVAKGLYPAGGGVIRTFNSMEPAIMDQLRILWSTEGYTPHALAAHPRLPGEAVKRLQSALVGMCDDAEGLALLDNLKLSGFIQAHDSEWDDVRALGIQLLDELVKQ